MSLVYLEPCMAWAHLEDKSGTGTASNIQQQTLLFLLVRSLSSYLLHLYRAGHTSMDLRAACVSWAGFSPVCMPQPKCWSGKWILRNCSLARVWFTETYNSLILQISAFLQLLLLKKTGSLEIFTADTLQCDLAQLGSEALHVFIVFK